MIEQYSTERELTFHKDISSAVAGLGQLLSQRNVGTYVAGLWKEDLAHGLMWFVNRRYGREGPNHNQIAKVRRKTPSWSWASAGKVYINFRFAYTEGQDRERCESIKSGTDNRRRSLEVPDASRC